MTATRHTLPRLHVGAGTTVGALTTFPLWVQAPSVRGLHWSGNELTIAEIAGSPSVDELTVTNRSQRPAVLLEGDLVEGGLQHRMVAASGLMAAGTTGMLAARCIEQGRWNGQQDHQATRRRAPYSVYAAERDHGGAADPGRRVAPDQPLRAAARSHPQCLDDRPPGATTGTTDCHSWRGSAA